LSLSNDASFPAGNAQPSGLETTGAVSGKPGRPSRKSVWVWIWLALIAVAIVILVMLVLALRQFRPGEQHREVRETDRRETMINERPAR
jgi:heme/copper-type cytochrome/quinol oxidase subunit 2